MNLTTNARNAERLAQEEQLEELIKRAMKYHDTLLFKVVRNIAQLSKTQQSETFESYLEHFVVMCMNSGENTDLQIEIIGTMVYMHFDIWEEVIHKTNFFEFLHNNLVSGFAEDDIVLESVMLLSTICRNEPIAEMIA